MPAQMKNRLDNLPNEILEMVMTSSGCITALHGLVTTNCQANALFSARPSQYLLGAMQRSGMETHLQALFCTIISIRQHAKHNTADETFRAYVKARLQITSTVPDLDLRFTPPSARIEMLRDAAEIQSCLAAAENSFVETQLYILTTKVQAHMEREGLPFNFNVMTMSPSPTELHRVRRALWRLALYFEAYFKPYIPLAMNARKELRSLNPHTIKGGNGPPGPLRHRGLCERKKYQGIETQREFFCQLMVWELEELECVWYHLSHQSQAFWRRQCPLCHQTHLPDLLFAHLCHCQGPASDLNRVTAGRFRMGLHFQDACMWFREFLEECLFYEKGNKIDQALWPDGPAREASAGFKFLWEHHGAIRPNHKPPTVERYAWEEFVYWGYAIWDHDRLEECRLVDASDGGRVGEIDWWRSDTFRGECLY